MSELELVVKVQIGADRNEGIKEALVLAKKLGVNIGFRVNNTYTTVAPDGTVDTCRLSLYDGFAEACDK